MSKNHADLDELVLLFGPDGVKKQMEDRVKNLKEEGARLLVLVLPMRSKAVEVAEHQTQVAPGMRCACQPCLEAALERVQSELKFLGQRLTDAELALTKVKDAHA